MLLILSVTLTSMISLLHVQPAAAAPKQKATPDMSVEDVVAKVNDAVVTVINMQYLTVPGQKDEQLQATSAGSGFFIDKDGYLVTNWHVTDGGDEFAVIFADGGIADADLVGDDPRDDLAVLKIAAKDVRATVSFGDSDTLNPGQTVVAIGSPLGAFTNTVTAGVVSALGRNEFAQSINPNCQNYGNFIQHTATINHGNSGGPLFNLQGEVIGVNTYGIWTEPDGTPVQGMFFSVPSNLTKQVAQEIIATGTLATPYIGADFVQITDAIAAAYDLPVADGMYISNVPAGTPAEDAGLERGDIVTEIDGKQIAYENTLPLILLDYEPGDEVDLTIYRDDEKIIVPFTFGTTPDDVAHACSVD
jgi:2-alkenal reductase